MSTNEKPNSDPITVDDLFVALALPPTLFGAPFNYTIGVMMLSGSLFIATNNPLLFLIAIPLMFFGRYLIQKDPYAPSVWMQFALLRTKLRISAPNWRHQQLVVSVSPLDYRRGAKSKRVKV